MRFMRKLKFSQKYSSEQAVTIHFISQELFTARSVKVSIFFVKIEFGHKPYSSSTNILLKRLVVLRMFRNQEAFF